MTPEDVSIAMRRQKLELIPRLTPYELNRQNKIFKLAELTLMSYDQLSVVVGANDRRTRQLAIHNFRLLADKLSAIELPDRTKKRADEIFFSVLDEDRHAILHYVGVIAKLLASEELAPQDYLPTQAPEIALLALRYRALIYPRERADAAREIFRIQSMLNLRV